MEEQIERDISLGRLPRNGRLASERMMARWYGVSRGTVREALRRLSARGLVVQRSGSQTRALALDESLTLENLSLALHGERSQECRRLLEGFFSLKRQVLVELLADCCAKASLIELRLLTDICFQLWDAARWHPGERCAQLEFELLRQAAQVAGRPGHLLLIQSLQRAFRGNAARLLTFMGGESLREWAICANHALDERDMQTLQQQLPVLLKACDELVLNQFAPVPQEAVSLEVHLAQQCSLNAPASASAQDDALEALPCVEERGLGCPPSTAENGAALEAHPCVETHELGTLVSTTRQDDAPGALPCVEPRGLGDLVAATAQDATRAARSCVESRGPGRIAPAAEETEPLGVAPGPHGRALPRESDSEVLSCPSTPGAVPCEPGGEGAGRDVTGATLGHVPDCRTNWDALSPDGGLPFEVPPTGSRGQVCKAGGSLHGAQRPLGRWAVRLLRFIARSLGFPSS
ncbi:FadR/GntR family transcriptional regulator [Corallococcus sp. 4LFB]|uniref:FadR/GntR family transcriptional regulator n=1 Tax=Corallococcus sp. 4LFB TaxID=3383249 RepID=UPI003976D79C